MGGAIVGKTQVVLHTLPPASFQRSFNRTILHWFVLSDLISLFLVLGMGMVESKNPGMWPG